MADTKEIVFPSDSDKNLNNVNVLSNQLMSSSEGHNLEHSKVQREAVHMLLIVFTNPLTCCSWYYLFDILNVPWKKKKVRCIWHAI